MRVNLAQTISPAKSLSDIDLSTLAKQVWLDGEILYRKLLPSRPPHHLFRHYDALFVGERDGAWQREKRR